MTKDWIQQFGSLLEAPSPAVLATYREDGTAFVSPVWFRFHNNRFEVVIAEGDAKLRHLERRPECSLVVFETTPPFRGVRIEGVPALVPDQDGGVRAAIAGGYLGAEGGSRFADERQTPGIVLRLEVDQARAWDLSNILPRD